MSQETPKIEESTKFNLITSIWIVPLIALLIAGWLAYQYFSELGPEIRITFAKNEGLQAGQSRIKYRDVPIGTVSKIELQGDGGDGVVVIARMDKTATPYLNDESKFWIVKPEVGISGVSGLDTLISGTYIDMYSKKSGAFKSHYVGLDHAYRNISGGEYFVLNTPRGESSVKPGTPLYLKNVKVGKVEYVVLALDDASVDIIVFIDKQYVPYVHIDSKFWVRSTLDVGLQNGNLDVNVAPVIDLIRGAIEFSTSGRDEEKKVSDAFVFELYKNKSLTLSNKIGQGGKHIKEFMLHTQSSIAKLKPNALVKYHGFKVGSVKEIKLNYSKVKHEMHGKVIVTIDTSVFEDTNDSSHTGEENFYQAVKEGLRAQVIPSDPITGMLYVDLTFVQSDGNRTILKEEGYAVLPTVNYISGDLMASATKILDKINALPLEKLLVSLNKVIDDTGVVVKDAGKVVKNVDKPLTTILTDLEKTVQNLNTMTDKKTFAAMPDEVNRMLKELTRTLQTTKKVVRGYSSNSLITKQLSQTLKIVTETSKEMQQFLEMLNRKPNSLIFGDH